MIKLWFLYRRNINADWLLHYLFNVDEIPLDRSVPLELHAAVLQGPQGVVAAHPHILTSAILLAPLSYEYISRNNRLTAQHTRVKMIRTLTETQQKIYRAHTPISNIDNTISNKLRSSKAITSI